MSDEGVRLVSRFALVVVLILVVALVRTMVGPSKARGRIMAVGQFGGLVFGVLAGASVSKWLGSDMSALGACLGIVLGWCVSWRYARHIPRDAT